jgi:hypothetical protein
MNEADYDSIIKWEKSILLYGNKLKENFYVVKHMMKLLDLGYQKINMCQIFCMLYYGKDENLTKCKTCRHARYKPNIGKGRTLVAYKKLRQFSITPRL